MKAWVAQLGARFRRGYVWFEEKPVVVLIAAAGTTVGVMFVLAEIGGWARVSRVATTRHSWGWLAVCLLGEIVAYGGYILTVRDMARVDRCADMSVSASAQTVVAGFGIFAATRSSGGFAVDYWAFRKAGATEKEAGARAVGLGLLEYVVLSIAALGASLLLFLRLDGSASAATTLPSLAIVPCLVAGFWVTSPKRAHRLARPKGGYLRRWFAAVVAGGVTLRRLLGSPREHGMGVLGSAIYWGGDIACLWAALQIVDLHISLSMLVLTYSGGYVLTRRSLPAGGAGVVEAALTLALVWTGLPWAQSLVAVVIYRLFNFWLPIVPALLIMPSIKQLRQRFQHGERVT